MESKNKKLKKNQEKDEREIPDLDRLSSLPDSILAHVLSFLDTRSAIKTSILSKRYQHLWTLSPCLDFSFSDYQTDRYESYDGRAFSPVKNSSLASFESSVNRVLRLREHSNLVKFRLSLHKDVGSSFLDNCIRYAADHKVQHLRIRGFVKQNPVALPKSLLDSSSLVSLHLHNATSNSIEMPKSATLPNLKLLRLKNFEFCDRNFNGEFFLGCPNLETLVLGKCSIRPGNKLRVLDVNCLNLKNLEIRYWRSPWKCFDEHVINVRAPKLLLFLFQGHLARVSFDCGLPCVKEACVDLSFPTACFMANTGDRKRKTSDGLIGMLRQMCNVSLLSLSSRTLEVMAEPPDLQGRAPIIFENLRLIRFTASARNKYVEVKMSVDTVKWLLAMVADDVLIFDLSKEKKPLPESSKAKKKESRNIAVAAHVIHFLLESSPSLELFGVEIPKESSGQE
ncbi:putative F-box/LRR-repeat protein at4g15060 [Phtheirospermum japonicum]|uniref:Putative F-box/LRR-repeat protein at4g15060 n=1 Tax=Phtheirospermum japonicum TaxID=374723 RepID=A0A830B8L5_9LAMI|nr:putative F-box/LRR-repeat protein at4g15060 [Phtheirospermum japonicum]